MKEKKETQAMPNNRRRVRTVVLCSALLFLGCLAFFAAIWYVSIYGDVGFDSILYTMLSDLGGVQSGLVVKYLVGGLLPTVVVWAALTFALFYTPKKNFTVTIKEKYTLRLYPFGRVCSVVLSVLLSVVMLLSAAMQVKLLDFIYFIGQKSVIFQEKYVDPDTVKITFPEKKRNLIYIFMESMESTFLSKEQGGAMDDCLIPELYELAEQNTNFSRSEGVGGFLSVPGTGWTAGAMVAQTAGLPLKAPSTLASNTYGEDSFLPGVTTITNVLEQNGYYQALMVGSDAGFGNRNQYYTQHGVDRIYDIFTARADGIVPEDYHVWWGMEDKHLYTYAKQALTQLSSSETPFAFTMLTADTHAVDGYLCEECGETYDQKYSNVLDCASAQLGGFLDWIRAQDFYENTTVVICGDHLTMDEAYISQNVADGYSRHVYNCFVNAAAEPAHAKNRTFAAIDLFPTTLAAMGCTIPGERLGLGTNLFSDTPTLLEEMGIHEFKNELSKTSDYYVRNFMF